MERILCAAIRYKGHTIAGYRHSDCLTTLELFGVAESEYPHKDTFGFLTSHDRYVSRREAWKIAKIAGQIVFGERATDPNDPKLISENLYISPKELE
jgi:hypothetical protein